MKSVDFKDDRLVIINQTKLPLAEEYIITDDYERIALSIERLEVRGAPAIGIAAAYAVALSFKHFKGNAEERFAKVFARLKTTRPTAVNLFWALGEMRSVFEKNKNSENLYHILISKAESIHKDDIEMCERIGANGLKLFDKKLRILTHCNTGALATGGIGTAFAVIYTAFQKNLVEYVYADETRPLLQGSRLTAFELEKAEIPFSIITDSAAAFLMRQGKVDLVITGADRIAVNGDAANKIGTYNLAVLCKHHDIPFYIAAPYTTIDKTCPTGSEIKIEERGKEEIISIAGRQITKESYSVYSPAFDVTPHELIEGIITETGLYKKPYNFLDV
ncbi:MAG: S-methyl-5-thioribose-1-phosphate isomerase [Chlorobi bacterium]|nr:S-methyl-5-thioribose-1-phosphate isomerase [Chlorobiota bacterium]